MGKPFLTKTHPGPQKKLLGFNLVFFTLFILTILFLATTVYAVIQMNPSWIPDGYKDFFSAQLLDAKTACSILITLVGLLLVRHHFVIGFRPVIVYDCYKTTPFHVYFKDQVVWKVSICNVGLGAALFSKMKFRLNLNEKKDSPYNLSFQELNSELKANGFVFEKDYYLMTYSSAFVLPSKENRFIFEIVLPKAHNIAQLDLKVTFKGFLGGLYNKEIFMIPRLGIPKDAEEHSEPCIEEKPTSVS